MSNRSFFPEGRWTNALIALVFASLSATAAPTSAALLLDTDYVWSGTEPTITGRITRDAIQATWAAPKAFPGMGTLTDQRLYTTFSLPIADANFLRVTLSTVSLGDGPGMYNAMTIGYQDTFSPADQSAHYLGDAGFSTGSTNPTPTTFEVIADKNADFVLVLFQLFTGTGFAGDISHVRVEGYLDANLTEPGRVPEPTTLALLSLGLAGLAMSGRRTRS